MVDSFQELKGLNLFGFVAVDAGGRTLVNQFRNVSPTGWLHGAATSARVVLRLSFEVAGGRICGFFRNAHHLCKAMVIEGGMRLWRGSKISLSSSFF